MHGSCRLSNSYFICQQTIVYYVAQILNPEASEPWALLSGISVDFLSLIERGRNAPSFETIEHIAKKLRVPVMVLFDSGAALTSRVERGG